MERKKIVEVLGEVIHSTRKVKSECRDDLFTIQHPLAKVY